MLFSMVTSLNSWFFFQKKSASLLKMAGLLWYLTEDLNLLGMFDRNAGLTKKCAMVYKFQRMSKKMSHYH